MEEIAVKRLTKEKMREAVNLVDRAGLDTREEIEHHLKHVEAHYVALDGDKVMGVIGWYQDNVNYAVEAMGDKFPGEEAYWVGFFVVDKEYRRRGIGYALLRKLEKVVRRKKVGELWVSSVPETKDYYIRQGFRIIMSGEINGNRKFFGVKKLE